MMPASLYRGGGVMCDCFCVMNSVKSAAAQLLLVFLSPSSSRAADAARQAEWKSPSELQVCTQRLYK